MNATVRAQVFARAEGLCECGCGEPLGDSGHLDHFFGRAKAPENERTCWALHWRCDHLKTTNTPSAAAWLRKFIAHCLKHRYELEAQAADVKLFVLAAKGLA